jgi:hypothetical protein
MRGGPTQKIRAPSYIDPGQSIEEFCSEIQGKISPLVEGVYYLSRTRVVGAEIRSEAFPVYQFSSGIRRTSSLNAVSARS